MSTDNEWNLNQRETVLFEEPSAKPMSRRIAFCPTCDRPFLHGNGVWQDQAGGSSRKAPQGGSDAPEYCSEACLGT